MMKRLASILTVAVLGAATQVAQAQTPTPSGNPCLVFMDTSGGTPGVPMLSIDTKCSFISVKFKAWHYTPVTNDPPTFAEGPHSSVDCEGLNEVEVWFVPDYEFWLEVATYDEELDCYVVEYPDPQNLVIPFDHVIWKSGDGCCQEPLAIELYGTMTGGIEIAQIAPGACFGGVVEENTYVCSVDYSSSMLPGYTATQRAYEDCEMATGLLDEIEICEAKAYNILAGVGCGTCTCDELPEDFDAKVNEYAEQVEGDPDDDGGCDGDEEAETGTTTENPVLIAEGVKIETATDLSIALHGGDFNLVRQYRSRKPEVSGLVGSGWSLNMMRFLEIDTTGGGQPVLWLHGASTKIKFAHDGTVWRPGGGAVTYIEKATRTIGSTTYPVWRMVFPGSKVVDFYRDKDSGETATDPDDWYHGLIATEEDVHNTRWTYTHSEYVAGATTVTRPASILFERKLSGGSYESMARVDFEWVLGRLVGADHIRFDGGTPVIQESVAYLYKQGSNGITDPPYPNQSLGTAGDLIQVTHWTAVDQPDGGDPAWRTRYTQYRYHDGTEETSDGDSDGFIEQGALHQLKMVIEPEQIEWYAQEKDRTVAQAADDLLGMGDGTSLGLSSGTFELVDLASKVVSKYEMTGERRVLEQAVQSGCGCGGGGGGGNLQALRQEYEYRSFTGERKTVITEAVWDDTLMTPDWVDYREKHFDFDELGPDSVPYLVNRAVIDLTGSGNKWVTHYEYDSSRRRIVECTPSAMNTYTPGDSTTAPAYTAKASDGLVYGYVYNADNRMTEMRLRQGVDLGDIDVEADFILVESTDWGDGTGGTREYLPDTVKRYQSTSSTAADDIEQTDFTYGFYTGGGDDLMWVKTSVERELTSENGPGSGTYSRYTLFDIHGNAAWERGADDALTKREYEAKTGRLASVTMNAAVDSDLTTDFPTVDGVSTSAWPDREADGGSLTTIYSRDLLGRVTTTVRPGGVTTQTVRAMLYWEERQGTFNPIEYYCEISLPHKMAGVSNVYDGPASLTWFDADNHVIGSMTYELSGYDGSTRLTYTLGTPLSKQAITHDISGLVEQAEIWHDVAGDRSYTTSQTYDELGRVATATNANGTLRKMEHDVLDRVVATYEGTSTGNLVLIADYEYDGGGVGNGNLTEVTAHVDSTSGNDRGTEYRYDFRDRLVMVVNPQEPHMYAAYDNLGRVVEEVIYSGTPPTAPTLPTTGNTDFGRRVLTEYGQRGLPFLVKIETDPDGASGEFLESHRWFDQEGRVVASWSPSAPGTKTSYDGLGRRVASYITDRAGGTDYSDIFNASTHASVLTDDVVLQQAEYRYIEGSGATGEGAVDLVTTRYRRHNETGDGDLSSLSESVLTYVGYFYDDASRLIGVADYGTNTAEDKFREPTTSDSAPTITQSSPPDHTTGNMITARTEYGTRGLAVSRFDPKGYETRYFYDDLYRTVGVAENYDNATFAWSTSPDPDRWVVGNITDANPDVDRVTSFVYDGQGNVVLRIAHIPDVTSEDVQITQYDYHTQSSAGSFLDSKDLLAQVHYPDESTGLPNTGSAYTVEYEYNRLGELKKMTDQNGITHTYTRDDLGRIELDQAGGFSGTDIDDRVQSIGYLYDEYGRLDLVTSFRGNSNIENEIAFAYDELWQLTTMTQSPVGSVAEGIHSGAVEYVYEVQHAAASSGDPNYSRLTDLKYPLSPMTGRTIVQPQYGSAGGLNTVISRAVGTDFGNLGVDEQYIGLSMPAVCAYDLPAGADWTLDRFTDPTAGTTADGVYPGYDRFGRIGRQFWTSTGAVLPQTDLHYTYDKASNVTGRYDLRGKPESDMDPPGSGNAARDEEYTYDGLHRLKQESRGKRVPSGSWTWADNSRKWNLDMLGNWNNFLTDLNGDGSFTQPENQSRTHNAANEITQTVNGSDPARSQTHDDAGNWTVQTLPNGNEKHLVYDAWNRLVEVAQGPSMSVDTVTRYTYYGLHQRATSRADAEMTSADADQRVHYYYDASWRLLERRIDHDYDGSDDGQDGWGPLPLDELLEIDAFAADENQHYIWGPHHIDELVAYLRDTDNDGQADDARYFAVRDRQFSVTGLVEASGGLKERVRYSAYGVARHSYTADITGSTAGEPDGAVDADDLNLVLGQWSETYPSYDPDADITRDGVVDVDDLNAVLATASALPAGAISDVGNVVGYDGYIYDEFAGMYCVRFRWYDPEYGRWVGSDQLDYVDGSSSFEYATSRPSAGLDWLGNSFDEFIKSTNLGMSNALNGCAQSLTDNITIFYITQTCILDNLSKCLDACGDEKRDEVEEWLMGVVTDFMDPLIQSFEEYCSGKPVSDSGWNGFFRRYDKGEYDITWTAGRVIKVGIKGAIGCQSFSPVPLIGWSDVMSVKDVMMSTPLYVAQAMMVNHIQSDLRRALQNNGVGYDKVWRCVGAVVDSCQKDLLRILANGDAKQEERLNVLEGRGRRIFPAELDVQRIRDRMRDECRIDAK